MLQSQFRSPSAKSKFAVLAGSRVTAAKVKHLRERHGLSPLEFGKLFRDAEELPNGYTKNYIGMLERGRVPITKRFEKHFERVRIILRNHAPTPTISHGAEIEIIANRTLPKRFHILSEIKVCQRKHCPVCKQNRTRYFVPRTTNQKQHVLKERGGKRR